MQEGFKLSFKRGQSIFVADCRSENGHIENVVEALYALPDKTKRGPPTNKNISIRNMKAQITNMSLNENSGFKTEYQVILVLLL